MQIRFTKMQGAGNDFVVLDETQGRLGLTPAQYRFLGDRHFGVGADQILTVRPSPGEGIDFEYVIHNADGGEVEQCGNGARCFARYVHDKGLTSKDTIRVQTMSGVIAPRLTPDGRVTVDMGRPQFDPARVPFDATGLTPVAQGSGKKWPLALDTQAPEATILVATVSMGNPHAVHFIDSAVGDFPLRDVGPRMEHHPLFPARVNFEVAQVLDRRHIQSRTWERGVGETQACGTGACAIMVSARLHGWVDDEVEVNEPGGVLTLRWNGTGNVILTGPAAFVYRGEWPD